MERKIGEVFRHNGKVYQCLTSETCAGCDSNSGGNDCMKIIDTRGACVGSLRSDKTPIIFKELKKIGNPVEFCNGYYLQKYDLEKSNPVFQEHNLNMFTDETKTILYVIIKQNEDMEEKNQDIIEVNGKKYKFIPHEKREACTELCVFRNLNFEECWNIPCNSQGRKDGHNGYFIEMSPEEIAGKTVNEVMKNVKKQIEKNMETSNLKPFNLKDAKSGKPVCTRDGRKARIICFDLKNYEYPIVAAVGNDSSEILFSYTINGKIADGIESDKDLMMLPEKKEGWINVYKRESEYICENECNVSTGIAVYKSEGDAKRDIDKSEIYINTIKIIWEE